MTPSTLTELQSLLGSLREQELTPELAVRLDEILSADPEARLFYVRYMDLCANLFWMTISDEGQRRLMAQIDRNDREVLDLGLQQPVSSPIPSSRGIVPDNTIGYISSGWPVAYLIATVIVGVGLLIGAWVHVSQPVTVVQQSPFHRTSPAILSAVVGRITGMVDCVWEGSGFRVQGAGTANRKSEIRNQKSLLRLGDRLALRSGLLEIAYDTGARVILQGPVAYEVESPAGGYLSVGKLTARLEKRGEGRGERGEKEADRKRAIAGQSEVTNQKSEIRSQKFVVRTPTAVVTDLGTEFGVEVGKDGFTRTRVFVGSVRVEGRRAASGAVSHDLFAGQAVQIDSRSEVTDISKRQQEFIRTMPTAKPSAAPELIGQVDYSDTWTANSPTRAGSFLILNDPLSLQVEQCHGNPPRSWVFSQPSALTTWPSDKPPVPWPGHEVPGSKSGFTEAGFGPDLYFGIAYGLRDDFVVQFDAVQTDDRINITIGDAPATIYGDNILSVFFRTPGRKFPQIGLHTTALGEIDTGIRSGIPEAWRWHNYAARFNLREKRITVWVDRRLLGAVDLANVPRDLGNDVHASWANLHLSNRFVTVGAYRLNVASRTWTDNFRIGSPARAEKGGEGHL